jgi:hypothetical protein
MNKKLPLLVLIATLLFAYVMSGCSVVQSFMPTETPTLTLTPLPTNTPLPPTPTPTPTEVPYYVDATVMALDQEVPIMLYHRFIPDDVTKDAITFTNLSTFRRDLQAFYDSGYSLVSLQSWLDGTYVTPVGRRPMILTMDDFWFADQIYIEDDGTPSEYSGVGVLWKFSQEHPDFGFSVAGFSNMGDKYYGDEQFGEGFIFGGDVDAMWQKLGETIAWAIENGVEPYNHLFQHPLLSITDDKDIQWQIQENDRVTRYYLSKVGREDLIPRLGNIIALPFGEWPSTQSGINILRNYKNQEGKPVEAIFEAYLFADKELTPSVYSSSFDRYNLPRLTASEIMTQWVVDQSSSISSSQSCKLGPIKQEQESDANVLQEQVLTALNSGSCPEGIYHVNGQIFIARDGQVQPYRAPQYGN